MPDIKDYSTLVALTYGTNIRSNSVSKGTAVTPVAYGQHGNGKSKGTEDAVKRFPNHYYAVIDMSQVGDGDMALPIAVKNESGSTEVHYALFHVWMTIQELEKEVYNRAQNEGLLNGMIKLKIDSEGNEHLIVKDNDTIVRTPYQKLKDGSYNEFKFGDTLSGELKMKLLEEGEVPACFVLLDELNRADMQVMKQFMNIILERNVYGYKLPWWTQLIVAMNPCSQNTSYATNQLDPAQWSRLLKIKVDTSIQSFVEYAMANGLSVDVVEAIANSDILTVKDKSLVDEEEMTPDPRAWEMVCNIYENIHEVLSSKLFNPDERKREEEYLRTLIRGKVGETAARTLLQSINDKENNIKATEIINGSANKINPKIVEKINRQHDLAKIMTSYKVVELLANEISTVEAEKTSTDPKKKEHHMNWVSQLKEFTTLLPAATGTLFVRAILTHENGGALFGKAAKYFASNMVDIIMTAKKGIEDLNGD